MAEFRFVTTWCIEAPLSQVSDAIFSCAEWPKWWKNLEKVDQIEPGNRDGIGVLLRFTWKGQLPYRLTFNIRVTRAVPSEILEGLASGQLEGVGCWFFSHQAPITIVRYEWHVRTTQTWMNLLAPVAKPLFKWNHDRVMRQGAEGLAQFLNSRLVGLSHGRLDR
ncbi:MAG TPA: SRPBCC family protein [Eoetvoesiella sp.]